MKKIGWITGGILLVAVVFFVAGQERTLWSSVLWGSGAAIGYLAFLGTVWLKKIASPAKRKVVGATLVALVAVLCGSLWFWYRMGQWQRNLYTEFETGYETVNVNQLVREPLVRTLSDYYESAEERPDMGMLFRSRYGSKITRENELQFTNSDGGSGSLTFYLAKAVSDSVVIIAESGYLEPMNAGFQNYSGTTGRYQVRGTVTREGVRYERVN